MLRRCVACSENTKLFAFSMAYQPVVDLHERRIDAYEALVRGPGGEAAPGILAQVTPANLYAFDQACRVKAIELAARLGIDCRLNINFLPNAVYEPKACIRLTLEAAARTGFSLRRLTFEIVESEQIADPIHVLRTVEEYRRHGITVALDDFSSGYSGLARLAQLRPDIIKLDRALVQDCDRDPFRLAIIASMIALCEKIGIKVVLEGVERAGEAKALRSVGGRFMQGFYFAKPAFEAIVGNDALWASLPDADGLI